MANKTELQQQLKSLGGDPGELTVAELKKAIKKASKAPASTEDASKAPASTEEASKAPASTEEEIEDNPTVKRQKAAAALRKAKAEKIAKANKVAEAKAAEQQSDSEKASKAKPKKDTRKVYTDDRGLKFAFKHNAPKSINIDGKSRKTSELLEDQEVMLELVYGNSNFIEQIH